MRTFIQLKSGQDNPEKMNREHDRPAHIRGRRIASFELASPMVATSSWSKVVFAAGFFLCVPVAEVADIPLQYNKKLTSLGFPSPLLRGTIRGQTAWFIIDTGAGVHCLASWLINAANIPTRETTSTVTGSTGVENPVRGVYNEAIRLSGSRRDVRLREAIATDFPAEFQEQRIGGLLSPQLLAPPGMATVLDLSMPRLSFRNFEVAIRRLRVGRKSFETAIVCSNSESPFTNRLYAAPMSAAGITGLMLVDTGATRSVALPSSPIAAALLSRASAGGNTEGIGGGVTKTQKVADVPLRFAGSEVNVTLVIGGAPPLCASDGLLGMDVLRQCVLILGGSDFSAVSAAKH